MSFSCKKSYNNSSWNKQQYKADSSMDGDDVAGNLDRGAAICRVSEQRGCTTVYRKDLFKVKVTEEMKVPDKPIMKMDESKLAVRKDDDNLGFAIKSTPSASSSAKSKKSKQNLAAELGLFASSSVSVAVVPPREEAPVAQKQAAPQELSWRNRSAK